jgi:predicted TPR repeat methyltransferase
MTKDLFKEKATQWDKGSIRTKSAKVISKAIKDSINLSKDMRVMDFGVGTGLLGFEILKDVDKVVGVDISKKMLEQLKEKNTDKFFIEPWHVDIIKNPTDEIFDGIVSSMTLHHVENLKLFFQTINKNLKQNGFIAIADLEQEDGTFHSNNEGVFHFGFNEKELKSLILACGFKDIKIKNINTIKKPHGDFGIFLLTAIKS